MRLTEALSYYNMTATPSQVKNFSHFSPTADDEVKAREYRKRLEAQRLGLKKKKMKDFFEEEASEG